MNKLSKFVLGLTMALSMVVAAGASAATAPAPVLLMGQSGANVSALQTALISLGYSIPAGATGFFGAQTKLAVADFQNAYASEILAPVGLTNGNGQYRTLTAAKLAAVLAGGTTSTTTTTTTGTTAGNCPNGMTMASNCTLAPNAVAAALCPNGNLLSNNCAPATTTTTTTTTTAVVGCPAGAAFNSITGASCAVTTTVSSTEGYLTDVNSDSTNRVSTVYESDLDKVVIGVRATARLADQTVQRVTAVFHNTETALSSANLAKYISSATLWDGSTKLATIAVSDAARDTSTDKYTFQFTGLSDLIKKDAIGRLYVSISANGSLDSVNTANAKWWVQIPSDGIRAMSPNTVYATYGQTGGTQIGQDLPNLGRLTFAKFTSSGLKATVNLSTTNPNAATVAVDANNVTNGLTVLKFTIKATNSDLNLRKIPIQFSSSATSVASIVNTFKLYQGTNLLDSEDPSAGFAIATGAINTGSVTGCTTGNQCGIEFINLSNPYNVITAGSTAEFTVVVDLKKQSGNYSEGDTLLASLANADVLLASNFSVQDVNGDQLTNSSSVRVGSAVGQTQTFRVNGLNVVMAAATISNTVDNNGLVTSVTYNIPITATSFGNTLYVGQSANFATAATGTGSVANAFSYALQASTSPATDLTTNPTGITNTSTLTSSDASIENQGYRLDSGTAKHFTLQVILSVNTASATTASYRIHVADMRSFTDSALTAGVSNQSLLPVNLFETGYQKVK